MVQPFYRYHPIVKTKFGQPGSLYKSGFDKLNLPPPNQQTDKTEKTSPHTTQNFGRFKTTLWTYPIALDVTKDESVTACVEQIFKGAGNIDIWVNNAGFGSYGAIEDVTMQDAKYQLEVNVFGAMRLSQLVLPKMRQNKYGKIVNISSVGGKVALPLGGWYHATKFAIEALSDAMRMEVKPFGIDVIVIEPGGTNSEWGDVAFTKHFV